MAALTYLIIPNANDQFSVSQGQIKTNFQSIMTLIDQDHTDFANSAPGKHFRVTFPVQSPAPTFSGGDIGFYSLLNPILNSNQLYFSNVAGTQIPITASGSASVSGFTIYYSYLNSGWILKSGTGVTGGTGTGTATVVLNGAGLPPYATTFQVIVTPGGVAGGTFNPSTTQLTAYTFQCVASPSFTFSVATYLNGALSNQPFQWIALGI
jgi:hypothetical protein